MSKDNPLEKTIQKAVQKYLDSQGVFWYHPSSMHAKGTPDLLACYKGRFVGIELKRPKNSEPTKLQIKKMAKIEESGGVCAVCRSVDEVKEFLKEIDSED